MNNSIDNILYIRDNSPWRSDLAFKIVSTKSCGKSILVFYQNWKWNKHDICNNGCLRPMMLWILNNNNHIKISIQHVQSHNETINCTYIRIKISPKNHAQMMTLTYLFQCFLVLYYMTAGVCSCVSILSWNKILDTLWERKIKPQIRIVM